MDGCAKTFIVEDSPVILENLVATLEELAPVKVVGTAPDEASALEWIHRNGAGVDLMIIDIFLKSGSGLGVLKATSSHSTSLRRVVLTNYATADIRKKCLELGADKVFDKSTDLDALLDYCTEMGGGKPGACAPGS